MLVRNGSPPNEPLRRCGRKKERKKERKRSSSLSFFFFFWPQVPLPRSLPMAPTIGLLHAGLVPDRHHEGISLVTIFEQRVTAVGLQLPLPHALLAVCVPLLQHWTLGRYDDVVGVVVGRLDDLEDVPLDVVLAGKALFAVRTGVFLGGVRGTPGLLVLEAVFVLGETRGVEGAFVWAVGACLFRERAV